MLRVDTSLARIPVIGTRPAILSAVLPLDHPPITSNLVREICQFLMEILMINVLKCQIVPTCHKNTERATCNASESSARHIPSSGYVGKHPISAMH